MDNAKTGTFIKVLRTELAMTQRGLAERLAITDRAVSKWERGLSAPGIDLLEPLADILGVSVTELIRGERFPEEGSAPAMEEQARDILVYSHAQVRRAASRSRGTALLAAAACWRFCWWRVHSAGGREYFSCWIVVRPRTGPMRPPYTARSWRAGGFPGGTRCP